MNRGALAAQTRTEVLLTLRLGESVLLTLGIPVLLLVFLSLADVLPLPEGVDEPVDYLFPGILALAVLSAALVGPAIATGFEREYGVLKRLGATPLGRPAIVAAKIVAVFVIELVQMIVLSGVALALGWRPEGADVGLAAGPHHARRRQRPLRRPAPGRRHGVPARRAAFGSPGRGPGAPDPVPPFWSP